MRAPFQMSYDVRKLNCRERFQGQILSLREQKKKIGLSNNRNQMYVPSMNICEGQEQITNPKRFTSWNVWNSRTHPFAIAMYFSLLFQTFVFPFIFLISQTNNFCHKTFSSYSTLMLLNERLQEICYGRLLLIGKKGQMRDLVSINKKCILIGRFTLHNWNSQTFIPLKPLK